MAEQRIQCPEEINRDTGRELMQLMQKAKPAQAADCVLDLSQTRTITSEGGAWVVAMAQRVIAQNARFRYENQSDHIGQFMNMIEPGFMPASKPHKHEERFFEEIGGNVYRWRSELGDFLTLLIDAIYWTILAPLEGRGFRWGLWFDEMYEMGVRAVRIVCLMNFLLGLIIAMLSAAQIAEFGLGIYVADLIVIAFARELAAIMTAVVVSARTGAAIAAELATMKVQEEIDALRGMGLNVSQFLVAPKVLALLIVMPCLVTLGMISGVLGGAFWGVIVLGFRPDHWFQETVTAASLGDILQGTLKTFVFAIMIVLVGCHNGFRVTGGSRGVGLMTTRAVVMDILFIIIIDIVFATVFYYVVE